MVALYLDSEDREIIALYQLVRALLQRGRREAVGALRRAGWRADLSDYVGLGKKYDGVADQFLAWGMVKKQLRQVGEIDAVRRARELALTGIDFFLDFPDFTCE